MMAMLMRFYVVILEIQRAQLSHIGDAQRGADMNAAFVAPAATVNLRPWFRSQTHQRLIRLAAESNITVQLAQRRTGSGRGVRANRDLQRAAVQFGEPLLRDSQLGWRTAPEQIRGGGRHDQKVRFKPAGALLYLGNA